MHFLEGKAMVGSFLVVGIVGLAIAQAHAEPTEMTDPKDREILQAFLGHVEKSAAYCTPERMARFAAQPEDITWQASRYIKMPLVAYKLTEDIKYLDTFVERMDTLCDCLEAGPDGFKGWYGLAYELFRHPDHPEQKVDVIITSFTMADLIGQFAQIVKADRALADTYGNAASRYLALAEDHLIEKWGARGNYQDLGSTGGVYITHSDLKPTKGHLTQPHNKHSKIIRALLSMYAATGEDQYAIKALRLGTRFKHCLTLAGDHYTWNYWDPSGVWDINPDEPGKWKHWIGAEHRGGYYSLSASQAVLLYEHGLVFDGTDIDRFAETQTTVCWNADAENPKWARVDGREMDSPYLCGWLAPFDERIFTMAYGPPAQAARLAGKDHSWQGGPVAMEYLESKYVLCPKWRDGKPSEAALLAPFLAKPENRSLVEELAFTVEGTGYQAPMSPSEMDPMPGR